MLSLYLKCHCPPRHARLLHTGCLSFRVVLLFFFPYHSIAGLAAYSLALSGLGRNRCPLVFFALLIKTYVSWC